MYKDALQLPLRDRGRERAEEAQLNGLAEALRLRLARADEMPAEAKRDSNRSGEAARFEDPSLDGARKAGVE